MRELLVAVAMICGLSCTPTPEHEQRVQCEIACEDYGDLVSMGHSDDLVQLLCTCGDGSTQIGAVTTTTTTRPTTTTLDPRPLW